MKRIEVTVQPKASSRGVEQVGDGRYKIRTTAAPDDGKANEDVVKQLAKLLGIAKTRFRLVRGRSSRQKTFEIEE